MVLRPIRFVIFSAVLCAPVFTGAEPNGPTSSANRVGERKGDANRRRAPDKLSEGDEAVDFELSLPTLIDHMDNKVAADYNALPDRLYLIGRDGKIAYQGARGPRGFRPQELKEAIVNELTSRDLSP